MEKSMISLCLLGGLAIGNGVAQTPSKPNILLIIADDCSYYDIGCFGATKFRNVTTSTNNHPYTLLGVKLLQYGKVTIDYPRGRFYFEAFQPDNEINNQGNNFDLTVKDGDLFVSTVWSSTKGKIAVGDKVVKINGTPAKKYDFCESILNGIPELKEKKKYGRSNR